MAFRQKQDFDAALQSLDCALEWEPESADCLQLRAEVWPSDLQLLVISSDIWLNPGMHASVAWSFCLGALLKSHHAC